MGEVITNAFTLDPIVGFDPPIIKKKRNLPGTPDPEAEVIALSPKTLMATNRFLCEICGRGFKRDQNLQLHRRGHNIPWQLRQRSSKEPKKRVYVCPERSCIHHQPLRALGDLTGIKKHFCRKHGEKKWKCERCSKQYAVQSDWKAHLKTCGTKAYKCDCGTIFSRRDSFLTHRAFCDALAEETARVAAASRINDTVITSLSSYHNTVHHFSSFPEEVQVDTNRPIPDATLWMDHRPQVSDTVDSTPPPPNPIVSMTLGALYSNTYTSCLNQQQKDYHFDCPLETNFSTISNGELKSTSLPSTDIKEIISSQLNSASNLYSTQHQFYELSQPSMSATALLQKAAQIGATSTTPSFLHKYITIDKLSEDDMTAMSPWQMYPSKRRRIQKDDIKDGETRDFLGVGVPDVCTSSVNEILQYHGAKFQ